MTMGNHTFDKKELYDYIDEADKLIVPVNQPKVLPGVKSRVFDVLNKNATQLTVSVSGELQNFIKVLSGYKVLTMESIPQTLEETFTYLYGGDLSD